MGKIIRPKPKDENQLVPTNKPVNSTGNAIKPQQYISGSNDLERLLLDGARGYQEHLQALLGKYIPKEELEDPNMLVPLYLLVQVKPTIDFDYEMPREVQQVGGVSTINKGFLPYLLGLSEEEINGMSNKDISELVSSLPEASLDIEITSPVVSALILALSAEPLGRPVIGAAAYLAKKDGVDLPIVYLNGRDYLAEVGMIEISTYYIKRVKEEYNIPQEMYLAALRSIKKAKEIYNERWSS